MGTFISRDGPGIADSPNEREVVRRYIDSSDALLKALGRMWPCGHIRTLETTHTIAGKGQCRRCRRTRWMRGFRVALIRRSFCEVTGCGDMLPPSPTALIRQVEQAFGLEPGTVAGPDRKSESINARAVAATILRKRGRSLARVGEALGGRDHSTILNLIDKIDIYARRDKRVPLCLEMLE